jgi:calcium permeable stress-gated cation channel
VQKSYFAFQVVQVFLVTTLTSAASAAFTSILQDPLSAKDLLSQNLPKASNFYLSYILVQCLGAGAAKLANFGDLFRHEVVGKVTNDQRKRYKRWRNLSRIHWGSVYPRFTNMGVIGR